MRSNFHPKVSIVIPVYNGSNYLKEAIDSALSQTYDNIEVIVVNDGSNDNGKTDEICKSYGDKIRYFVKENGGVATALNKGIEEMRGEYFSWLSHDDVYYPNKVEEQIKCLSELTNKKTVIFSNVEYIDKKSETIYKTSYETEHSIRNLNTGYFSSLKGFMNGCSMLIHREVFDRAGFFNEKFKTCNDYDMWFRISKSSEFFFFPQILIKYRLHEEQGTKTIPHYERVAESDLVWSNAIKESFTIINSLGVSIFDFYYDLAMRMLQDLRQNSYLLSLKIAKKEFKKNGPEISVIMPCYNAEKYLGEAIDSIINQTFHNFELIIVDDYSTDRSNEIINEYLLKDFRIKKIKNNSEKGVAHSMNRGISISKASKYLTRMDADDISLPTRLEKQINFLDENMEYGFCSVNMEAFEGKNIPFLFEETDIPLEWLFLFSNPMASAATMYRISIIKDNQIKFGDYKVASDYDFLCKVLLFSKPYMLYNESLYKYRIHQTSIYQKNTKEALYNSIKINESLIKNLLGEKAPIFHKTLTTFEKALEIDSNDISIMEAVSWIQLLLEFSSKKWKWQKKEYIKAQKFSNDLLARRASRKGILSLQLELDFVTERLRQIDKSNKQLILQNKKLSAELAEIEKRNSPLKKIYSVFITVGKLPFLIKEQGLSKTIQSIIMKIRNKARRNV